MLEEREGGLHLYAQCLFLQQRQLERAGKEEPLVGGDVGGPRAAIGKLR